MSMKVLVMVQVTDANGQQVFAEAQNIQAVPFVNSDLAMAANPLEPHAAAWKQSRQEAAQELAHVGTAAFELMDEVKDNIHKQINTLTDGMLPPLEGEHP